jgi:hypothetical protein
MSFGRGVGEGNGGGRELLTAKRGEKWVLKEDNNTKFFHLYANGRRRKKTILSLEQDGVVLTDREQIQDTIYSFYKQLFGFRPKSTVGMDEGTCEGRGRLSQEDNEEILKPFSKEEVKKTIFEMKEESALGPDGFSECLYKNSWEKLKGELMAMVNVFYLKRLDLGMLNYGVITLVPKVTDANNGKQFRPICLLNKSLKLFTKLINDKLARVAKKVISPSQTSFIKG